MIGIEVINPERLWPLEEILHRFAVPEEDARELRAYFSASGDDHSPRTSCRPLARSGRLIGPQLRTLRRQRVAVALVPNL